MPLLKDGREAQDAFVAVAGDAPLPYGPAIVPLKWFLAEKDILLAHPFALGVILETSEKPEALGDDIHSLAVVVLKFPLFKDGRVFSQARVLRTRMHYAGEIRATGHFLIDQIAFLTRVGVDTFDLLPHVSIVEAIAASKAINDVYQPATDRRRTIRDMRPATPSASRGA